MKKIRTRFAPSPTGFMHLGGMRTALYAFLYAKARGGDFILRIEDTDRERFVDGAIEVIYSTLKDGGLIYDEGPNIGGEFGPYIQSERMDIYKKYAEILVEKGGAYYCFCDKKRLEDLKKDDENAKYDKHCLNLSKEEVQMRLDRGDSYVIRQNIPSSGVGVYNDLVFGEISVDYKDLDDNVLIKSDGMPTYNFANVVDDHLMQISHVIRGVEYLSSTPKYNLMYDAFGWERPEYIHLPVIMKDANRKLSKRFGDANFDDFIAKGYIAPAIMNYIALLGWCPKDNQEKMTLSEMIEKFSLDGVSKSPSIFDEVKLRWLNGEYLKAMDDEEFFEIAKPFFAKSKVFGKFDIKKLAKLLKSRVEILSEIPEKIDWLCDFDTFDTELYFNKKNKTNVEVAKELLPKIIDAVKDIDDFSNANLFEKLSQKAQEIEVKTGAFFWIMRIAITGQTVTPGGATEMAEILGKEETISRLRKSLENL